jgi:uncharacterized delta-60 repeat protein
MKKLCISAGVLSVCLAVTVQFAQAAAGSLDPTFGKGGKIVTSFTTRTAPFQSPIPTDAALQPDGKIVIAVTFSSSAIATEAFGVARYLPNGSLDKTFGSNGSAQTAFTNFINGTSGIALQSDGKIVVVGTASSADGTLSEFAVARFNGNGSLDSTFGQGGKVTTNFVGIKAGGVSNPANAVLIQSDGKILVGGAARECGNRNCPVNTALARYNADGSLDATFGTGGMVDVAAIGGATTLGLDAAGDIFVLNNSLAAEFSSTGVLLPTITPAPLTVVSHGGLSAFQSDGNYLVPEGVFDNGNDEDVDAQIVRFLATGAVDASFNSPVFDFAPQAGVAGDDVQATTLQSNGQIVVGGLHSGNGGQIFGMARFNAVGSLDATFGVGGTLTTSFGAGSAQVFAVLVQADGKIVAVGQTSNNQGITSIALARYLEH